MFSNKKAAGESNLGKILLVALLVLIIAYLLYFFFIKNFVEKTLTECPVEYCKDACDFATEYRDGTKICKDNDKHICCKPINPATNPLSAECKGKKEGDYCGGTYPSGTNIPKVCTEELKCVELCAYCATNPTYEKCNFNPNSVIGKDRVTSFSRSFKCGCTRAECTPNSEFACIPNFCSSNTPTADNYYCCNK